ncbi:hypothetical protein V1264_018784 [Littorina saxatilis]
MEAKLAEYRAKRRIEETQAKTTRQRLWGFFRTTTATDEKCNMDNISTDSTIKEDESFHIDTKPENDMEEVDEGEEDIPPPPPGKYSWVLFGLKILLWLILWGIFIELQFGAVFFAVSALVFVYKNTRTGRGRKKKSLSAYSVFNPNCERLQGTITAEQLEANLLYRKPLVTS